VPLGAAGHACMITMVDSAEDPLDPNIRAANIVKAENFVPQSRHIAQRNLTISPFQFIKLDIKLYPIYVPLQVINTTPVRGIELAVSQVDLQEGVTFLLQPGVTARGTSESVFETKVDVSPGQVRQVTEARIDTSKGWKFRGNEGVLYLDLAPGESTTAVIIATPPREKGTARFSVVERQREQILGGNTYLLRPE